MKKSLALIIIASIILSLSACGSAAKESPEPSAEASPTEEVVVFTDTVLEKMVREAMNKPEGDITIAEAEAVTKLDFDIEWQSPDEVRIKDISALKYFKNLEGLEMNFHKISDISPLAGLTKLKGLAVGGNEVNDISALSGLTELDFLCIFNCTATDYSPLKNLTKLRVLFIDWSKISDLTVLSGLTRLEELTFTNSQVTDVTPLAVLTNLKKLKLAENPITDLSPLKDIYPNLTEKDFEM